MSVIYSIDFTSKANQAPLSDSGNWSIDGNSDSQCQILSGACQPTPANGGGGISVLTPTLGLDQYAQVKVGTITAGDANSSMTLFIRSSNTFNNNGSCRFILRGDGTWAMHIRNGSLVLLGSGTTSFNPGDVFILAAIGTQITVTQNGNVLATATNATASASTQQVLNLAASNTHSSAVLAYTAGNGNPFAYSEPDCRNYSHFPNASRTVQGTSIFDVQTSSNSQVPGTDSRAAGAPVDSRTSSIIPTNSRTPGTFGPGE